MQSQLFTDRLDIPFVRDVNFLVVVMLERRCELTIGCCKRV